MGIAYGNPEVTPGGRALKFYSSVRIEIRKKEVLKNGSDIYGNHVLCKVVKNKVAPPFKTAEFDILYGKGISKMSELCDMGVNMGILEKSGSWFSYDGQRIGQGRDKAVAYLEENPAIAAKIEEGIRKLAASGEMGESFELDEEFDLSGLDEE